VLAALAAVPRRGGGEARGAGLRRAAGWLVPRSGGGPPPARAAQVGPAEAQPASPAAGFESAQPGISAAAAAPPRIGAWLRGKNIFVSGATGFLAKVLVEKILWEQPEVGQLYLLVRGGKSSVDARLAEVLQSPLFDRLREREGAGFEAFVLSKLRPVEGALGREDLGLSAADLRLLREEAALDVVLNSAASTTFNERYDQAVLINTLGARQMCRLAQQTGAGLYLQVSTAFVNGEREGRTSERPFEWNRSIAQEQGRPNAPELDVHAEIELARTSAERYAADAARQGLAGVEAEAWVGKRLSELGMERARMHGWQDTYVFTKAMGEMLAGRERDGLPLAIVRPAIVEGAYAEPLPGWIEGIRMCDPIILAYGRGQLSGFCAFKEGVLDVVPVDFVVATILGVAAKHHRPGAGSKVEEGARRGETTARHQEAASPSPALADHEVYHVGSSVTKPLRNGKFAEYLSGYFAENPMLGKDNKPIVVSAMKVFRSSLAFLFSSWVTYMLPLKLKQLRAWALSIVFWAQAKYDKDLRRMALINGRTFEQMKDLASLYAPYTYYSCRFDASNTMQLYRDLCPEDQQRFNCNLEDIDWKEYLQNVHVPGLRKFILKGRGS